MTQLSELAWLPTPSVTQVPPLVTWQYVLPLTTRQNQPDGVGGASDEIGGGGDGDGGGGEAIGGSVPAAAVAQMIKPPYVTEPSVYQEIVAPDAISKFDGPAVPLKRVPPIVMKSKPVSVEK